MGFENRDLNDLFHKLSQIDLSNVCKENDNIQSHHEAYQLIYLKKKLLLIKYKLYYLNKIFFIFY